MAEQTEVPSRGEGPQRSWGSVCLFHASDPASDPTSFPVVYAGILGVGSYMYVLLYIFWFSVCLSFFLLPLILFSWNILGNLTSYGFKGFWVKLAKLMKFTLS